jgi:formiminoglutamase
MPAINGTNFSFHPSTKEQLNQLLSKREGEVKLGEKIQTGNSTQETRFILLGIEESMGPQANKGLNGAQNGFNAFLKRFVNMQSNRFLNGSEIFFIGTIKQEQAYSTEEEARSLIKELDSIVEQTLTTYLNEGITPIVIGGGHNNAYPLIKSISKRLQKSIDVVNLDPHADCRQLEGRHSGNPFSYAKNDGYLNHYTVLGLHKAYNSEFLLHYLDKHQFQYTFFEDYISDPAGFFDDVHSSSSKLAKSEAFGIELDLDSIQFMPSSAFSPSGFTIEQARFYIHSLAYHKNCCYLHLPEGAPTNETEEKIVGKTLAYLVWDFISRKSGN